MKIAATVITQSKRTVKVVGADGFVIVARRYQDSGPWHFDETASTPPTIAAHLTLRKMVSDGLFKEQ